MRSKFDMRELLAEIKRLTAENQDLKEKLKQYEQEGEEHGVQER